MNNSKKCAIKIKIYTSFWYVMAVMQYKYYYYELIYFLVKFIKFLSRTK